MGGKWNFMERSVNTATLMITEQDFYEIDHNMGFIREMVTFPG